MNAFIRKSLFAGLFACMGGITVLTGQAAAQGFQHGFGARIDALVQELDLNESQQATLNDVRDEIRTNFQDERERMRGEAAERLVQAFSGDEPDFTAIHGVVDQRMQSRTASMHAAVDGVADFYRTLDPDQKAIVNDKVRKVGALGAQMGHGRGMEGRKSCPLSGATE